MSLGLVKCTCCEYRLLGVLYITACLCNVGHGSVQMMALPPAVPNTAYYLINDISSDGRSVTGTFRASPWDTQVFHWKEGVGSRFVGVPFGHFDNSFNSYVSRDGSEVVAARNLQGRGRGWHWDEATDRVSHMSRPGDNLFLTSASADVDYVAGYTFTEDGRRPFRRRVNVFEEILDVPEGIEGAEGNSISADGRHMAIGLIAPPRPGSSDHVIKAGRWQQGVGMTDVQFDPSLNIRNSTSTRISDDGSVVAGILVVENEPRVWAFRETDAGVEYINDASWRTIFDMTPDGSLMTGAIRVGDMDVPAIWTPETGTMTFRDYVGPDAQPFIEVDGPFYGRLSVADDGRTFAANLSVFPYLVVVPAPAPWFAVGLLGVVAVRRLRRTRPEGVFASRR